MGAGDNRDCRVCNAIPDQVGEAVENRAPNVAIQDGVDERRFSKSVDSGAEFSME